jgi:hypothetical protein
MAVEPPVAQAHEADVGRSHGTPGAIGERRSARSTFETVAAIGGLVGLAVVVASSSGLGNDRGPVVVYVHVPPPFRHPRGDRPRGSTSAARPGASSAAGTTPRSRRSSVDSTSAWTPCGRSTAPSGPSCASATGTRSCAAPGPKSGSAAQPEAAGAGAAARTRGRVGRRPLRAIRRRCSSAPRRCQRATGVRRATAVPGPRRSTRPSHSSSSTSCQTRSQDWPRWRA